MTGKTKLLHCRERALRIAETALSEEPLALFEVRDVLAEIESLRAVTGSSRKRENIDITAQDEQALLRALKIGSVGPDHLPTHLAQWMAVRIDQVRGALKAASNAVDEQGSPTACVLPIDAGARRIYLMLTGSVPLAWVRILDVLKF